MADPVVEKLEEEKAKIKSTQKRRIRGVLIIVNALLISYFSFLLVSSIVDYVKTNLSTGDDSIITVLDKSESTSLNLYKRLIGFDENTKKFSTEDVNDFAIYGHYLLTSKTRVTPSSFYIDDEVYVVKIEPEITYDKATKKIGSTLDKGIDLYSLGAGDYFLAKSYSEENKYTAYHYKGEALLQETIYSLPNEKGIRKKITVSGKDSSPAIVISVSETTYFPENFYDLVVIGKDNIPELKEEKHLKVKYCNSENSLLEAYKVSSNYCISYDGTQLGKILTSNYVSSPTDKPKKIEGGVYDSFDYTNEIRELGGYVFSSGYGAKYEDDSITKSSTLLMNYKNEEHKGKYVISVSNNIEFSSIKNILGL